MKVVPVAFLFASALVGACSSSDAGAPPVAPNGPSWTDAVSTLELREGIEVTVPLTIKARDVAEVKVEVTAPDGVEARVDGTKLLIRADYNLGEIGPMSVTLDDGQRTTVTVPLRVKHLEWLRRQQWSANPAPREHGVFFFDAQARAAYLFEGSGFNPQWKPIDDSWKFDVGAGTWASWSPTGDVPNATAAARVAAVQGQSLAYLHGGYHGFKDTEASQTDLFRVDVAAGSFAKLAQQGGPPPRQLHVFAHDAASNRLVVFGGVGAAKDQRLYADTWLAKVDGDKAIWSQLASSGPVPSARYGGFYGLDSELRRLVVWSGAQAPTKDNMVNPAGDAWGLDLSSEPPKWSKLAPGGTTPQGRRNGCGMFNPIGHRLFVFGGTPDASNTEKGLFVLDVTPGREKWSSLSLPDAPPVRSSGFGFVDGEGNAYCGFGNDAVTYTDLNVLGYAK